jgi:hypothetical protein
MIPKRERAKFKNIDTSGELEIDMNEYRAMLRGARREVARNRAVKYARPRRTDDDPEYVP